MKYKQNQISSQFENEYIEVARKQRSFKEEIDSIFNDKKIADLILKNEFLEKLTTEKCEQNRIIENELSTQKRLFEDKVKELLKRITDQDVELHKRSKGYESIFRM